MTKPQLKKYIEKDIKKLEAEQAAEVKRIGKKYSNLDTHTLSYLISRKHTLKEIYKLL